MHKQMGKSGAVVAIRTLLATMVMLVFFVTFCQGQGNPITPDQNCLPDTSSQPEPLFITVDPAYWDPGNSYDVVIHGLGPPPGACNPIGLASYQWPQYPDSYEPGPIDPGVSMSTPVYTGDNYTFTATVSAATTPIDYVIITFGTWAYGGPIYLQPPPPPPPPGGGSARNCPIPTITSVTPSTWIAGQTYPITVRGTGFITAAKATSTCPISVITVSVNTGTVTLSNVVVVDSTTISATVTPANTDPDEQAEVILWASYDVLDDDDDVGADAELMTQVGPNKPTANANGGNVPSGYIEAAKATAQITNVKAGSTTNEGKER